MSYFKSALRGLGAAVIGAVAGAALVSILGGWVVGAGIGFASAIAGGGVGGFVAGFTLVTVAGATLGGLAGSFVGSIVRHEKKHHHGKGHGRVAAAAGVLLTAAGAYHSLPALFNRAAPSLRAQPSVQVPHTAPAKPPVKVLRAVAQPD